MLVECDVLVEWEVLMLCEVLCEVEVEVFPDVTVTVVFPADGHSLANGLLMSKITRTPAITQVISWIMPPAAATAGIV